jgi:trehalose-phosphatase
LDETVENFFESLKTASRRLLLLDYDGTLAPFVTERDKAYPYPGIEIRLDKLINSVHTDVVIISGRALHDLKPLFKLKKLPEIWGSHGWESQSRDGRYSLKTVASDDLARLTDAREYVYESKLEAYLEEKPVSLAVHVRGLDDRIALDIITKIKLYWDRITADSNLICDEFDGGLEIKVPGFNKGHVVSEIFQRYSPPPITAYLGDDLTDEDAFRALENMALRILVRNQDRPTAADIRIIPPDELIEFLDRWIEIENDF